MLHRPVWSLPHSPSPGRAYRGPAQTGEPPTQVGFGHGSQRFLSPVLSRPRSGNARRSVGSEQLQWWLGTSTAVSGRAERAARSVRTSASQQTSSALHRDGGLCILHSPDVKTKSSYVNITTFCVPTAITAPTLKLLISANGLTSQKNLHFVVIIKTKCK